MPPHDHERVQDGNRGEKKTIPKFASFKPKLPSPIQPDESSYQIGHRKRRNDTAHSPSLHGLEHHEHLSSKSGQKGYHRARSKEDGVHQSVQTAAREPDRQTEEASPLYVVDKIGDPDNLAFGALHRYTTSAYYRAGNGNVLGSEIYQKIDRTASNEKAVILSHAGQVHFRRGDRRAFWKAAQTAQRELKIRAQSNIPSGGDLDHDFVFLQDAPRVKRRHLNNDKGTGLSSSSDKEESHYKSINGKKKFRENPEDQDLIYASDSSHRSVDGKNDTSTFESSIQSERVDLSRRIDADPTDSDAWFDLINLQDKALGGDPDLKSHGPTTAERRSTSDIKLSMYEKALKHVSDPDSRERLLVGKMRDAARVWDRQKLSSEWQSVIRENPRCLTLSKEYLDFKQTSFVQFRYEDVRHIYATCLNSLASSQSTTGSIDEQNKLYAVQKYILLRMTLFIRETGFTEQAVATWQAWFEYEFHKPSELSDPQYKERSPSQDVSKSRFEAFWDSEVPRIGEEGSRGWAIFEQRGGDPPTPKTEMENNPADNQNLWNPWVSSEHSQSLQARMTARTIDDTVEDDPYRVILFSDVQLPVIGSSSVTSRFALIDAFLQFCHLPSYRKVGHNDAAGSWTGEPYLRNDLLNATNGSLQVFKAHYAEPKTLSLLESKVLIDERDLELVTLRLFDMPMPEYQLSSDTMFAASGTWFSAFDSWCTRTDKDQGPLKGSWVRNTLSQLVAANVEDDDLAEYFLALELRLSPERAKKTARGLLKKRPSSLQLYNAYAYIEYRLGSASAGEKTLMTSIRMATTLNEAARQYSILLWRTWLWELLTAGDTVKALNVLLTYGQENIPSDGSWGNSPEGQSPPSTSLLRSEKALTITRDHLLSLRQYRLAALAIDCLILLAYLKNASTLSAALATFHTNCADLTTDTTSSITSTHELLHQSFARLLYHHAMNTHLVKPSDIRSILAESITLFPHNTIFLSLYAWNEARFRINDRLRSLFQNVVLAQKQDLKSRRQDSVIPHFFAIYSEMDRAVTSGSNISTIRSTFERAVGSDSGAHCAGLWKLYFLFEHSRGDMGKAKNVFWRAIRACPWAKALYLLAFEYLQADGGMSDGDLRGIYELMCQKELRIHVNLEDVFDRMDEEAKAAR